MKGKLWPCPESTLKRIEELDLWARLERLEQGYFDDEDWGDFAPNADELGAAIMEILLRNKLDRESSYVLKGILNALCAGNAGIKLAVQKNTPSKHAIKMQSRDKRYSAAGMHAIKRNAQGVKMEAAVADAMQIYGFSRRDVFRAVKDMRNSYERVYGIIPELRSATDSED